MPDPIAPVKKCTRTTKSGKTVYLQEYKNAWINGASHCIEEKTVGKLAPDGKAVIFGAKFLESHPEYRGLQAWLHEGKIVFEEPEAFREERIAKEHQNDAAFFENIKALSAGAAYLFWQLAEESGISRHLRKVFRTRVESILSLAIYFAIHPEGKAIFFENFSRNHLLPGEPLSTEEVEDLFESISSEEVEKYLDLAYEHVQKGKASKLLAFQTQVPSYAQGLWESVNFESSEAEEIVMALLVDQSTGEPVYYRYSLLDDLLPSGTQPSSFFPSLDFEEGSKIMVLEKGIGSDKELEKILSSGVNFVAPLRRSLPTLESEINKTVEGVKKCPPLSFSIPFDSFLKTEKFSLNPLSGGKEKKGWLYVHAFLNLTQNCNVIEAAQHSYGRIKRRLSSQGTLPTEAMERFYSPNENGDWAFDEGKWKKIVDSAGLCILLSNCEKDGFKALEALQAKMEAERAFLGFKDRCGGIREMKRERGIDGKIFVLFLALALYLLLEHRFLKVDFPSFESLDEAVDVLESIYAFRRSGSENEDGIQIQGDLFLGAIPEKAREFYKEIGLSLPPKILKASEQ